VPAGALAGALSRQGLWLDLGAVSVRVRSDSPVFARQLRQVYPLFDFEVQGRWADLQVRMVRPRGWRRWIAPQVFFEGEGERVFDPFPADSPLPHFEWGTNWLIGRRMNQLLLFHAGAVERDGLALLLPATPGSGKSTFTAALSLRGWRLLSDEFGAWDPQRGGLVAVLKPVALKNESIDVIGRFAPGAPIGPRFPNTRKGTVAHLAVDARALKGRHAVAAPGAVILPRWQAGAETRLVEMGPEDVFPALAYNAFNYGVLGEVAFDAALRLARTCPAWRLTYSRLDEAVSAVDEIWSKLGGRIGRATTSAAAQRIAPGVDQGIQ
jgi:HprK-related kinase A